MRRIVAWINHPARPLYRLAGKALQIWLCRYQASWEVWNLGQAREAVLQAAAILRPAPCPCTCRGCGGEKPPVTIRVADAGQAFEAIPRDGLMSAAEALLRRAPSQVQGVWVLQGPKLAGHLSLR